MYLFVGVFVCLCEWGGVFACVVVCACACAVLWHALLCCVCLCVRVGLRSCVVWLFVCVVI